jgi:Ca2+/Na+ antiporter
VVLAVALIIFNITLFDFKHPFKVTVLLLLLVFLHPSVVLILLIFKTSKKIEEKNEQQTVINV